MVHVLQILTSFVGLMLTGQIPAGGILIMLFQYLFFGQVPI